MRALFSILPPFLPSELFPYNFDHTLYPVLASLVGVANYPVHAINGSNLWAQSPEFVKLDNRCDNRTSINMNLFPPCRQGTPTLTLSSCSACCCEKVICFTRLRVFCVIVCVLVWVYLSGSGGEQGPGHCASGLRACLCQRYAAHRSAFALSGSSITAKSKARDPHGYELTSRTLARLL